jgi:hypothetical protein
LNQENKKWGGDILLFLLSMEHVTALCVSTIQINEMNISLYTTVQGTGLPWQKLHSTRRRRLFLPANWT